MPDTQNINITTTPCGAFRVVVTKDTTDTDTEIYDIVIEVREGDGGGDTSITNRIVIKTEYPDVFISAVRRASFHFHNDSPHPVEPYPTAFGPSAPNT